MRVRAVIAVALVGLATRAGADDTVFDFVAPRADQQGAYAPGPGAIVVGGVGTLAPIAGWIDEAWALRRPLTVTNGGAATLDEWPLAVTIDATDPAGLDIFSAGDPLGADLRLATGGAPVPRIARGVWNASENRGVLWFQAATLPPGATTYDLYYGAPAALPADDVEGVFTFSSPVVTRYLAHPGGATVVLASPVAGNAWSVGGAAGTLGVGELATVDATMWAPGDSVATTGPIDVVIDTDAAGETAPLAFASTGFEIVVNRGAPSRFTFVSPLADTTVTIAIAGSAVATVPVVAGAVGEWVGAVPADSIVSLTASAPIVATYRGDDLVDGFVLPPAATEVWGVRSGTARIHALGGAATVTVYDSNGGTQTVSVPANGFAALAAGGSGTGEALRLGSTQPITVVANGDGDGGDAIVFHPVAELGRAWVVPTAGRFVIVATTGVGTTCTWTTPAGATVVASASVTVTPPAPGRVMFGATTGSAIVAGSIVRCDAPGFAYYEDAATDDERNLFPMESHRKRALVDPVVSIGGPEATRYRAGLSEVIDTPDFVAPTGVVAWQDLRVATIEPAGANLSYLVSIDGGATWLLPAAGSWTPSPDPTLGVTADAIGDAMSDLATDTGMLRARVILRSVDGVTRPEIDAIRVFYDAAGNPDRIRWDPTPSSVTSGDTFAASITAIDGMGNVLTGVSGQVTLTTSHGGKIEPDRVELVAGRASFDVAVLGVGDDVTIVARGPQGLVGTSLPFDLLAPPGSRLEIEAGDGQFGEAETELSDPLVVRAIDPDGFPLVGAQITFAAVDGGGTVAPTAVTTGDSGLASARLRLGPPGAQRVRAEGLGRSVTFVARSDEPGATPPTESGCGCRIARRARSPEGALLAALALALSLAARRRRSRSSR